MSLSGICGSCSNRNWPISSGSRPKMLKDLLVEDSNSWSSRRLASLPRLPSESSIKTGLEAEMPSPYKAIMLMRSRSKAASMTMSALEAMVKVARAIPRTLSKRQSGSHGAEYPNKTKSNVQEEFSEGKSVVRIKDIIRWSSFRDLAEEEPQLLKLAPPSPVDCTTATTVSTLSTSSTSSSWCESDFSSDYSPPWSSNDRDFYHNERFTSDCPSSMLDHVKRHEPAGHAQKTVHFSCEEDVLEKRERSFSDTEIESKEHTLWKESKGGSPVSVIDFEVGEDGEWRWSIKQSPAHVDFIREQALGAEEDQDEVEAMQLLHRIKSSTSGDCTSCSRDEERLLADFFRSELPEGCGEELVRRAECWMRGECHVGSSYYEWGFDGKKEAYLRDMEKGESWTKFDEDHEDMAVEIESAVWNDLVDELLSDIYPN